LSQILRKRDEKQRKRNRIIYETLSKEYRIMLKDLSTILGVNRNAAAKILREAFEQGYVLPPQLRKCSYANLKEYMYFLDCTYPHGLYKEYSERMNVPYHAVMAGFANFWIVSNEEIDVEGNVLCEGQRSDYYIAFAPDRSWEKAMQIMRKKVEIFNPEEYEPKGFIETHWNETVEWDSEDEAIFRAFKYNGRNPLTPVMRNNLVSSEKIYKFLEKLPECCTVFTRYFPKSLVNYDPHLFIFETNYEDFIIELFSELPTSAFFFRVSNKLFLYANVDRASVRKAGTNMWDVSQLHIPLLIDDLLQRDILRKADDAIVKYAWRKNL